MIQYNNFLMKREQSRAGSRFAECEKSRLKAKILITLALLLTAVTGAWADEPNVYNSGTVDLRTLKMGDILMSGVTLVNEIESWDMLRLEQNRYAQDGITQTAPQDVYTPTIGENGQIEYGNHTYTPVTEGGEAGGAWVVLSIADASYSGHNYKNVCVGGIEAPLTVTWDATTKTGTFTQPAGDVELTPIYSAATIYDADGETEKQAYETLKEAIAAVQDGDIIKLDWDVTLTEQLETPAIAGGAEFTLDLNGYIIDGNSGIYLNNVGDRLLFTDSSEGQTGGYIAGDLLGQTGSVFAFDAGRYKFGSNTAEALNDYCATPDSPWEMIDGKEFVDIDGAPDADGFTLRVDYKTFELAIPAGKFATFCDNHNVALAPGTDASVGLYTISSIDAERTTATATAISSAVVPGTMPMLVYNGSDADQKVKLKVSPDDATGAQTWAEAFQGTAIEHEFTATDMQDNDYYALSGGQYFVPVLSAGTIAAHKCWLQFPKQQTPASRSLTIVFEGNGTTGIADNKRESITNNRYYDLNGRQLNAAPTQKGVYILNGKKVVVK